MVRATSFTTSFASLGLPAAAKKAATARTTMPLFHMISSPGAFYGPTVRATPGLHDFGGYARILSHLAYARIAAGSPPEPAGIPGRSETQSDSVPALLT